MARLILITLDDNEDEIVNNIIGVLAEQGHLKETFDFTSTPLMTFPGLEINVSGRKVIFDGKEIVLTAMEFDVLFYLAKIEIKSVHRSKSMLRWKGSPIWRANI